MNSENNGTIWWTKLTNSSHLVRDVRNSLLDGNSVVISFGDKIPWQSTMIEIIAQKVGKKTDNITFDFFDAANIETSL